MVSNARLAMIYFYAHPDEWPEHKNFADIGFCLRNKISYDWLVKEFEH